MKLNKDEEDQLERLLAKFSDRRIQIMINEVKKTKYDSQAIVNKLLTSKHIEQQLGELLKNETTHILAKHVGQLATDYWNTLADDARKELLTLSLVRGVQQYFEKMNIKDLVTFLNHNIVVTRASKSSSLKTPPVNTAGGS